MAIEISEFVGVATMMRDTLQLPDGEPIEVHTTLGVKTIGNTTVLIRINPLAGASHTITWDNDKVETFESTEFRRVRPGQVFTVA